jgi:hypothetical protein
MTFNLSLIPGKVVTPPDWMTLPEWVMHVIHFIALNRFAMTGQRSTRYYSRQSPCKGATWAVHKCVLLKKKSQLKVCRMHPSLLQVTP